MHRFSSSSYVFALPLRRTVSRDRRKTCFSYGRAGVFPKFKFTPCHPRSVCWSTWFRKPVETVDVVSHRDPGGFSSRSRFFDANVCRPHDSVLRARAQTILIAPPTACTHDCAVQSVILSPAGPPDRKGRPRVTSATCVHVYLYT